LEDDVMSSETQGQPAKQSEASVVMGNSSELMCELQRLQERLGVKLSAYATAEPPSDPENKVGAAGPSTAYFAELHELSRQSRGIVRDLNELLDRVEL
jgi:hypothetical protein